MILLIIIIVNNSQVYSVNVCDNINCGKKKSFLNWQTLAWHNQDTSSEIGVQYLSISVPEGTVYTNVPLGVIIGPQGCFLFPFVGQKCTYLIPTIIKGTKTGP